MGTQGALFYKSSGHTFRTIGIQDHVILNPRVGPRKIGSPTPMGAPEDRLQSLYWPLDGSMRKLRHKIQGLVTNPVKFLVLTKKHGKGKQNYSATFKMSRSPPSSRHIVVCVVNAGMCLESNCIYSPKKSRGQSQCLIYSGIIKSCSCLVRQGKKRRQRSIPPQQAQAYKLCKISGWGLGVLSCCSASQVYYY